MRLYAYVTISTLVAASVIFHAYYTRVQFYPTVIYLVTSKFSIMVMCNMALVITILFGQMTKSIFLGSLRDAEIETLYENSRYAVTETCLALTIFREEINLRVVALFTALLFTKIFHWLGHSRVEHIEQTEIVSRVTHIRILALMACLCAVDVVFVTMCGMQIFEHGPTVLILFGFEFLILLISLVSTFIRYMLHMIDMSTEGTWTNKSSYVFYLELLAEVCKVFVYLLFFMIIFTYYGMPLHIVRDLWMSIKNLQRRLETYMRYRRLTANMNERFPSPTEEQLSETDRTCIICREELTPETAKILPCSHMFHINCLRMWLQRQQICPTCRSNIPVVPENNVRVIPPPAGPRGNAAEANAPRNQNVPNGQPQVNVRPPSPQPAAERIPQSPPVTGTDAAQPQEIPRSPPITASSQPIPGFSSSAGSQVPSPPISGFTGLSPGAGFATGSAPISHNVLADSMNQNIRLMQQQMHAQLASMEASLPPGATDPMSLMMQQQIQMMRSQLMASQTQNPMLNPVFGGMYGAAPSSFTTPSISPDSTLNSAPTVPTVDNMPSSTLSQSTSTEASIPVASAGTEASELEEKPTPMSRREELRRRYNRIYGASSVKTEEKKE